MDTAAPSADVRRTRSFEVICAGEPLWRSARWSRAAARAAVSGGLLGVARMLARKQVRVGLATVLEDDRFGRASLSEIAALGMDVGGVKLVSPVTRLVVVDAAGGQSALLSRSDVVPDLEIPASWSSSVLLLSGLSALTSRLAAFCRAARRARREGTTVVLDLATSLRQWLGHDARTLSMLIREADVVRCSFVDLAGIGMDAASVRRAMRAGAALVLDDPAGTTATGAFGEVRVSWRGEPGAPPTTAEACTAAICAELARPRGATESPDGRWARVLREGVAAVL